MDRDGERRQQARGHGSLKVGKVIWSPTAQLFFIVLSVLASDSGTRQRISALSIRDCVCCEEPVSATILGTFPFLHLFPL